MAVVSLETRRNGGYFGDRVDTEVEKGKLSSSRVILDTGFGKAIAQLTMEQGEPANLLTQFPGDSEGLDIHLDQHSEREGLENKFNFGDIVIERCQTYRTRDEVVEIIARGG